MHKLPSFSQSVLYVPSLQFIKQHAKLLHLSVCLFWGTRIHTLCFKMSSMLIQRPSACVCLPAWLSYLCTKASCTTKRCFPVKTKASSTLPPLSPVFLCLLLCLDKLFQCIWWYLSSPRLSHHPFSINFYQQLNMKIDWRLFKCTHWF